MVGGGSEERERVFIADTRRVGPMAIHALRLGFITFSSHFLTTFLVLYKSGLVMSLFFCFRLAHLVMAVLQEFERLPTVLLLGGIGMYCDDGIKVN